MKKIENKKNFFKIVFFIIFILAIAGITVALIPVIKMLPTAEGRLKLKETVESFGGFGGLVFVLIQICQIVVAFIPGEPIEIISGMLFGSMMGFFLCMIGIVIGTVLVFYLVRWLGEPLVSAFVNSEKLKKYKILNDEKRLESLVFILFLIPGTPKDVLTYLVPLTKIRPKKYFVYSSIARIPSVISSTIVGSTIGDGNWALSIVIFAVTALVGFVGILYNDKLLSKYSRKKKESDI